MSRQARNFVGLVLSAALLCVALHGSAGADQRAEATTEKVLYSFCSQPSCKDGAVPWAGVLRVKGDLYATAQGGGDNSWGTVVAVDKKTGAGRVVYSFESKFGDARMPMSALIDVNGTLYGTTAEGGVGDDQNGAGTIYSLNPKTGQLQLSYSFCIHQSCTDGALPEANLLEVNGSLYGTTNVGGRSNCFGPYPGCGVVFSLNPVTGKEKVIYSFCKRKYCADGSRPFGSLIDVNGILYGTATEGGKGTGCNDMAEGCGTVFALDPATSAETVLHTFGGESDGGTPIAGLIYVNGLLYGTTEFGGSYTHCSSYPDGCGTVFSVDAATGTETILHVSGEGSDGQYPVGGLTAVNGTLYGTTEFGGAYGSGTVFAINLATGKEKVVYSFCGLTQCHDGANPTGTLIQIDARLYGTTETGGTGNESVGTIFSINP